MTALSFGQKVRRIDFSPSEWLTGTSELSLEEKGAYWDVCSLIYLKEGPIDDDDKWVARAIHTDVRKWRPIKARLLHLRKLYLTPEGKLSNSRCETELTKARKRIDRGKYGVLGGRPRTDVPPDVPGEVTASPPTSNGHLEGHLAEISTAVSSEVNGVEKPKGLRDGKPNHQPSTINHQKEEVIPPQVNGKTYAFVGRIVRLTQQDFDQLEDVYRETIPDLQAELAGYDEWYDENVTEPKERGRWFHRLKSKLNNRHQQVLRERRQNGAAANLNESF